MTDIVSTGARPRMPFFALLAAQAISVTGSRMTMVALPWLVLVDTGSAAKTGLVAFAETLPYVLASALGGPAINRIGPRRMAVGADVLSAGFLTAIALLHLAGQLSLGGLAALVAVVGLLRSFADNSKRVLLPYAVEGSGVPLERATGLTEGIARLAMLIGAPIAGVLATAFEPGTVLLWNAAALPLGATVLVVGLRGLRIGAVTDGSPGYLRSLRVGFGYLRSDSLIVGILLVLVATNLFDQAYFSVLLPVWVHTVEGTAAVIGLVTGAMAAGAVIGNAVFTALATRLPRYLTFTICFVAGGAPRVLLMGFTDEVWVMAVAGFGTGLAISAINPILYAVAYRRIPRELQANVFGLAVAFAWAGIPLGSIIGGWVVETLDFRAGVLVLGVAYLAITLLPLVWPAWRELDRPAPAAATSSS